MSTLVTGAAGFIGSHVVSALAGRGDDVVAVVRPGAELRRLTDSRARVRVVELDLNDAGGISRVLRADPPDRVIHLAWYAKPADYLTSRANLDALMMTSALAEQVFAAGCRRLIVAGSCIEYAPADQPHQESDPVAPDSIYAACKHAAHLVCDRLAREHEANLIWARIFYLYGPGEATGRLIPMVVEALQAKRPIELTLGDQVRDLLHVSDVAAAFLVLTRAEATGTYNISSGVPVKLKDVLLAAADVVGGHELLRFGGREHPPGERMYVVGDPGRLETLGWKPRFTSLRESLAYLANSAAAGLQ